MTAINGTTTNTNAAALAASTSSATGTTSLGKDDFLKLLVTQMENQDPLNPSDPTAFTAQLAQFSSLEQLTNINTSLQQMSSSNQLSELSMIGQKVVAQGDTFQLGSNGAKLGYELTGAASKVQLQVQDSMGNTVATLNGDGLSKGDHFVSWDGKGDNGQAVPPGTYSLVVGAVDGSGNPMTDAAALVQGTVTGVNLDPSGNQLVTDAGTYTMSDIKSVGGS
jgi:flagellar basal-body rod modification protein FlgD